MYLIAGLGNPGDEYKNTRHNVGFDVIDLLSKKYNIQINRSKYKGIYGEGSIGNEKVILLKPQTFMNLSGESIVEWLNFYKLPLEKFIVVYDDISLEVGRIRIRGEGSAGGHNGIKSIIKCLPSQEFKRVRVGVGAPKGELVSHVLGKFSKDEREKVEKAFEAAVNSLEAIMEYGVEEAMNRYNAFRAL